MPVYFIVVLALIRDLRRPLVKKIFNPCFLTIFLYIVFWDLIRVIVTTIALIALWSPWTYVVLGWPNWSAGLLTVTAQYSVDTGRMVLGGLTLNRFTGIILPTMHKKIWTLNRQRVFMLVAHIVALEPALDLVWIWLGDPCSPD